MSNAQLYKRLLVELINAGDQRKQWAVERAVMIRDGHDQQNEINALKKNIATMQIIIDNYRTEELKAHKARAYNPEAAAQVRKMAATMQEGLVSE